MADSVREAILTACRHFMNPIARFLMRNGITFKEFAEVSKVAFVEVASSDYGLRGRPTNISRVAVLTGLTRKEVKRLRDSLRGREQPVDPTLGRPAQILTVWHQDVRFIDSHGHPKILPMDGDYGFRQLVREVGGDVPPGAMLTELIRAGAIEVFGEDQYRCKKRYFNPEGIDEFTSTRFGECLHDLAETMVFNLAHPNEEDRRFEYRVWNERVNPETLAHLQTIVRKQGRSMLEILDDLLTSYEIDPENATDVARCGVGVYYFEQRRKLLPKS